MTDTLLGCDPAEVSPGRAGAIFSEFAKSLCASDGIDFTAAWNKAKLLHPELHARLCQGATAPALANDTKATPYVPLAQKSFLLPAFYLPPTTTNEVFTVAYGANGNQSVTIDPKKIFLNLVAYIMKTSGVKADVARRQMQDDYPQLSRAAGQMPDQQ